MDEADMKYLNDCHDVGLYVWFNDGGNWRRVKQFRGEDARWEYMTPEQQERNEPGPLAIFFDGTFAALDTADRGQFMVTPPEITKWPEQKGEAHGG